VVRDRTDSYDPAFYAGAALCAVAALLSVSIRRRTPETRTPHSDEDIELSSVM
jgi:hypothetical protein